LILPTLLEIEIFQHLWEIDRKNRPTREAGEFQ